MATDFEENGARRMPYVAARSIAAADASQRNAAAVLVVALVCGSSGLLLGLGLAVSPWPALSFVFGAVFAGGGVWFMRDLMEALR